jgi:dienelactone hydrolase
LETSEIDSISVPVQICAPETDPQFTPELKEYTAKVLLTLNVEYDYQYFPGLVHGFAGRGDMKNAAQRKGLERAKNAAVYWFQQHLHPHLLLLT